MKSIRVATATLLLLCLTVPAHADFKYTSTSKITGGALMGAMKLASAFSRKNGQDPLQGITTTYYLKGNRLKTEHSDGMIEIIDLDARNITSINSQKKTYSVQTFDEMKAALQPVQQQAVAQQEKLQQDPQAAKDPQVTVTPTFKITPGSESRVILGQPTTETTMQMDLDVQAQAASQTTSDQRDLQSGQPGQPVSANMTMTVDMYVAPDVSGHRELTDFYARMAKELNWVPPANFQIDPRAAEGLAELQKNSSALKGLPLLEYVSMEIAVPPGQMPPDAAQDHTPPPQQQQSSSSASSSGSGVPTSAGDAVMKGLGGMFNRKKQQQKEKENDAAQSSSASSNPPPSRPNALMQMTIEVTSFSNSSIDGDVFAVPSGYVQEQGDANRLLNRQPRK